MPSCQPASATQGATSSLLSPPVATPPHLAETSPHPTLHPCCSSPSSTYLRALAARLRSRKQRSSRSTLTRIRSLGVSRLTRPATPATALDQPTHTQKKKACWEARQTHLQPSSSAAPACRHRCLLALPAACCSLGSRFPVPLSFSGLQCLTTRFWGPLPVCTCSCIARKQKGAGGGSYMAAGLTAADMDACACQSRAARHGRASMLGHRLPAHPP